MTCKLRNIIKRIHRLNRPLAITGKLLYLYGLGGTDDADDKLLKYHQEKVKVSYRKLEFRIAKSSRFSLEVIIIKSKEWVRIVVFRLS